MLDDYSYDVGEYELDLSKLSDPEALDGETIHMSLDVGELAVVVPADMDVNVIGTVHGPGGTTLFGSESGGIDHQAEAEPRRRDRRPRAHPRPRDRGRPHRRPHDPLTRHDLTRRTP